jgi:hypothetical protein
MSRLICDSCGKQFVIGNLESYQDLEQHAKKHGWTFIEDVLCSKCIPDCEMSVKINGLWTEWTPERPVNYGVEVKYRMTKVKEESEEG